MLKYLIIISSLLVTSPVVMAKGDLNLRSVSGNNYTFYNDPFKLADYVKEPKKAAERGINKAQWKIKESGEGFIKAELDYKGYLLRSMIFYNDKEISFEHVSAERNDCAGKRSCQLKQRHVDRWRLNLRRQIALELTKLAKQNAISLSN
ncbi:hypothetical protein [Pseudoalteromonas luteoviolacea]|uniref:hypothetical protein n=1 Tax=Pseudoalteromonas luteoviolacea TaxID=43657 RepID=UPI001B3688CF|nr:hypothetical protein [Pseudoalteromonas luteoviolacea]MBQ4835173.1 hypothetical protein [Pseudoalteromonas luteoviolacea]